MLDDAVTTQLPADLSAPAAARRFVAGHASALPGPLVHDATLLVSELVTNAVRYGRAPITVRVEVASDQIAVAVDDRGETFPALAETPPEPDAPSGRGLLIVAAVAQDWGVLATHPGTRVWFRLGGGRADL